MGKKNINHSVISFLIKTTSFLPTSLQTQSIELKLHLRHWWDQEKVEWEMCVMSDSLSYAEMGKKQTNNKQTKRWSKFTSWMLTHFAFPSECYKIKEKPTNWRHKALYGLHEIHMWQQSSLPHPWNICQIYVRLIF